MSLSAVLLCGGESRRMGADKATLPWRGRPLWQWQLGKLRALEPEKIFVSARARPHWLPGGVDLVTDQPPSRGPLSGLRATLQSTTTDYLLALAIDLPRMTPDHLRFVHATLESGQSLVPVVSDNIQPLAAIYHRASLAYFEQAARERIDVSLQGVIGQLARAALLRFVTIPSSEARLYENVNTPGDWARVTRARSRRMEQRAEGR